MCYAMVENIPHALAYGMHCVVWISIPYGHMPILCIFDHLVFLLKKSIPDGWKSHACSLLNTIVFFESDLEIICMQPFKHHRIL